MLTVVMVERQVGDLLSYEICVVTVENILIGAVKLRWGLYCS